MFDALRDAQWLTSPLAKGEIPLPAPFYRKNFSCTKPLQSARLEITACGIYEVEINGQRVGDEVFAPGWTDYRKRLQVQSIDVTPLLQSGENVLGVIISGGWYCGKIAWKPGHVYGPYTRFLAALTLTYEDQTSERILTDATWQTCLGPILSADLLHGETYDARKELQGWSSPGYTPEGWSPVEIDPAPPHVSLVPRLGPPVRKKEEFQPISTRLLESQPAVRRLLDFGQNFSGWAKIRVRAKAGTAFELRFAEVLNPDGTPYYENLRAAKATDLYICGSDHEAYWEPRFTFHGFRYAEVTGGTPEDEIEVTGVALYSDMPVTGEFRCSNPLLNQLQSNIQWGQKSNFLEIPTDCPQRDERIGWTGDAQVFIRTACFNMNVLEFFRKWLQDLRDCQLESGAVPGVAPDYGFLGAHHTDGGPAWADANIICPWTLYLCYGDLSILKEHYSSMRRYMDFVIRERSKDHIRSHPDIDQWGGFGDWLALDKATENPVGATRKDLIGTAFHAQNALIMSKVAGLLGLEQDQQEYAQLHQEVKKAFQRRFVTAEGLLVSDTQTAYTLALHFDLLPKALVPAAIKELVRDIESRNFHLSTGFVGTPYLLGALEKGGRLDIAYRLLEQENYPSWLFPVKNGATTIWERWDGWHPERGFQSPKMNSFNHYAYGAVGAWMVSSVAGLDLDPEAPGYRHILFRPRPGGSLTFAEASLKIPNGTVSIRWEKESEETYLATCNVPRSSTATFSPPPGYCTDGKLKLSEGEHQIRFKKMR